jgi:hypothetical protein
MTTTPIRLGAQPPKVVPLATVIDVDGLGEIDDTPVLPDETDVASPQAALEQLLTSARRRVVPIRRTFVQLSRANEERTGNLARLVAARQRVALDLLLLLIALFPVIGPDDPIAGKTWAHLLSSPTRKRSPATVSRTWAVLEELGLVQWTPGRPVELLCEDGSGEPYTHPGNNRGDAGYFGLPRRYWLDGWHHRLGLPAKAVLLVIRVAALRRRARPSSRPRRSTGARAAAGSPVARRR